MTQKSRVGMVQVAAYVEPDLHRRMKVIAALEGVQIQAIVEQAVRSYVAAYGSLPEKPTSAPSLDA